MVQYYNTGDKDSTNLIAYASDLSMFAMLFTDMQNGTRDYGNDRPIKSVEVAILSTIEQNPGITVSDLSQKQQRNYFIHCFQPRKRWLHLPRKASR